MSVLRTLFTLIQSPALRWEPLEGLGLVVLPGPAADGVWGGCVLNEWMMKEE